MLTVQNITHRYGRSPALSGVSLALAKGETLGLLGQNGAGKSTLLKIITGYIAPSEGVVKVAGQDINRHPAIRGEIGYLPEKPPLYDDMRVDEQLVYLARLKGLPRRKAHSEAAVLTEKLGLGPVSRRLTGNLSKGYRQRVGLAGALIGDPPLLVLDEPTSGLDPGQRQVFARLVEELAPRHAIIISSHIVSEVRTLSSRLAILHQGRLVADGEPYKLEAGLGSGLRVRVEGEAEEARRVLLEVKGVRQASLLGTPADSVCDFYLEAGLTDAIRRGVSQKLWEKGIPLLELRAGDDSLDIILNGGSENGWETQSCDLS